MAFIVGLLAAIVSAWFHAPGWASFLAFLLGLVVYNTRDGGK